MFTALNSFFQVTWKVKYLPLDGSELERHANVFTYGGCKDFLNCHYFHLTVWGMITSLLVSPFFLLILTVMIGCAFGMTQPRTFVRSVVLLVGRTGWQVLGDGHGLLCFLRCFIARGAVPSCTNTNYSHNPSRRIKITSIAVRATYWIYHLHSTPQSVFYLASGPFPGPPLSPCGASTLMEEKGRCRSG